MLRVHDELPAEGDERGDNAAEEKGCLPRDPRLVLCFAGDERVEGDQRQSLQVWVSTQLLRRRVMLVVLVAPVAAGHTAANAICDHLQVPIHLDVPRQRVVAAFVLEPAAPPLCKPRDERPKPPPPAPDKRHPGEVHRDHLRKAVCHVCKVWLEVSFCQQLLPQRLVVSREPVLLVLAGVELARWQRAQHLVCFLRANVEVVESVRGVGTELKLDH
mmetsp:Transcript_28222/g.65961  ORF Transcript_28222/g.65961 Transcript_28222/m.65961 type:complete len:216 (-) Transcript_28222:256-903(-)